MATSSWKGLDQLIVLDEKDVLSEGLKDQFEIPEMHESPFKPVCNMILSDPKDRRYQTAFEHRKRFGRLLHRASVSLQEAAGEDLVDAIAGTHMEYNQKSSSLKCIKLFWLLLIPLWSTTDPSWTLLGGSVLLLMRPAKTGSFGDVNMIYLGLCGLNSLKETIATVYSEYPIDPQ